MRKRILFAGIACSLIAILAFTGIVFAAGSAGSCNAGAFLGQQRDGRMMYTCTFTGDDATGAIPDTTVTLNGYILKVVTDPGNSLTDNYDIVMNGPYGSDVMGGALANRDTTSSETAFAYAQDGTTVVYPWAYGTHTLVFTNNTDTTSSLTLYIYVQR